jgi:hypothetical protein
MKKRRDHHTPEFPNLSYHTPTLRIPQADGSMLLKAGKPVLMGDEISVSEFARRTGNSVSTIEREINEGRITEVRRKTTRPKSPFLIKVAELERYLNIRDN